MDEIIKKVFHYIKSEDRYLIAKWCEELPVEEMMHKTYELSNEYMSDKIRHKIEKKPDYISRIIAKKTNANEKRTYVDIGGGNGDVLSYIRENVVGNEQSDQNNYVCVESKIDWAEPYPFSNTNIRYEFWDNQTVNVPSNFAHVVLCMVSLHHMDDQTILCALREMRRILCKGGVLLLKEHDCYDGEVKKYTVIEHHLYHVRTMSMKGEPLNAAEYLRTSVFNFKPRVEWLRLFMQEGFVLRGWKNRILGSYPLPNATQLFWGIFTSGG